MVYSGIPQFVPSHCCDTPPFLQSWLSACNECLKNMEDLGKNQLNCPKDPKLPQTQEVTPLGVASAEPPGSVLLLHLQSSLLRFIFLVSSAISFSYIRFFFISFSQLHKVGMPILLHCGILGKFNICPNS